MNNANKTETQVPSAHNESSDQAAISAELMARASAICAERLSYRDVLGDAAPAAQGESAMRYATVLAEWEDAGRGEEVAFVARDIRSCFDRMRSALPPEVTVSVYADSESWILWDIAKQEALKDEPYAGGYYSGSAIEITEGKNEQDVDFMREAIAARHFGWEVHQMALRGDDMSWLESKLNLKTGTFSEGAAARDRGEFGTINNGYHQTIWEQVHKVGDTAHNGQLPSSEYLDLGLALQHVLTGNDYFGARVDAAAGQMG